jgi:hypothetical protein
VDQDAKEIRGNELTDGLTKIKSQDSSHLPLSTYNSDQGLDLHP